MALQSIRNHRGFFSDYWLGTVLGARGAASARLTAAQARKALDRVTRLVEAMNGAVTPDLTRFREKFARPFLYDFLGFELQENAVEPRLRPLSAANGSESAGPSIALALLCPDSEEIESRQGRKQLEDGLLAARLDYGFLLSPEVLRLIRRPGLGMRGAALDLGLASVAELQDVDSLAAAYRVLAAQNFLRGADDARAIDAIEAESRQHSARVSNDLKDAVFEAAERIVGGFLEDVRARTDAFTSPPELPELRDAGFLALYRLLFILYAEARDERLIRHPLYQRSYSLDHMVTRLLKTPPESLAANRHGLWMHLSSVFRIFNEGIAPNLPDLDNIPPRGGRLFSEETDEGRLLRMLRLNDRQTAAILLALATTRPRRGVGRERVSYRELEIEQLGAVYEGLLEYEPEQASETLVECRVAGRELVLAPRELVRLVEQKSLAVRGDAAIVAETEAARLHPGAVQADNDDDAGAEEETEAADDSNDDEEEADKGVKRGAALKLLGRLEAGAFFFKPGAARKSSGSFYTRTEIVDYEVREALAPLVAGKSAAAIEALRVIDLACGSGHYLVGAARYLGARLFDAYKRECAGEPPPAFHPDRALSAEVRRRWDEEGAAWCKRRIVEKCLFGVDLNPAAVQLAQVALWIESLAGDRPLSFFAHHIRNGNSLLGSWLDRYDAPPHPKLGKRRDQQTRGIFEAVLKKRLEEALAERRLIDAPLPPEVRGDTPDEYAYKEDRLRRAEAATAQARLLLDLRSASAFLPAIWREFPALMSAFDLETDAKARPWWMEFRVVRERERFFHWELEFPEVFAAGGFDCVLGNPPWEKVKPDRKEFYGHVDVLIRAYTGGELDARIRELHAVNPALKDEFEVYSERLRTLAACLKGGGDYRYVDWEIDGRSTGGDPDLFKFFVERAHRVLRNGGRLGYLVPSGIYNNEGCTGLRHLLLDEMQIDRFFGFENKKNIFPIDSTYKFVCVIAEKIEAVAGEAKFSAVFMRHEVEELTSGPPPGVQVVVRGTELEQLSPGTLAFLEYRTERDRELVRKMYGLLSNQTARPLLGSEGEGAWKARFYTQFHMTNDRDLWTRDGGRLWTPREICGLDWPANRSIPIAEVRAAMAEKGYWPLYEGKHIDLFVVDTKPIERWVSLEAVERKYGKQPSPAPKLVFRDIAKKGNQRTCIAAVLPPDSCANNKLIVTESEKLSPEIACGILCSFTFDYLIRFRVTFSLNFTHMSRVAVPPVAALLSGAAPITTVSRGGLDDSSLIDDPACFGTLWANELHVARAYGLAADDFEHILASFPALARKCPKLHAFLKAKTAEWASGSGKT